MNSGYKRFTSTDVNERAISVGWVSGVKQRTEPEMEVKMIETYSTIDETKNKDYICEFIFLR